MLEKATSVARCMSHPPKQIKPKKGTFKQFHLGRRGQRSNLTPSKGPRRMIYYRTAIHSKAVEAIIREIKLL